MKKILFISILLLSGTLFPLWTDEAMEEENPMLGFIMGSYILVGQAPENGKAYKGTMSIMLSEKGKLEITRVINGKKIITNGKIDSALAGEVTVFTITFVENKKKYNATYLISSDLDNYARLTGYVYLEEGDTRVPGFEALFPDFFQEVDY